MRFDTKFQIIAQLFDSIQFEMKKLYLHSTIEYAINVTTNRIDE